MNKIITAASIIAVCCFSACANKEPDHDSGLMGSDSLKPATTITTDPQNIVQADTSLPGTGQALVTPVTQPVMNQVTPTTAPVVNQASTTTAPGMNPPHGQPNHRCDIAVGAPLNSAPTKPATQTVSTTTTPAVQPTATPAAASTAKTVTAPGMNPPHGEPGHRCDISVGAPLNSPVTKPAAQTVKPVASPVPVTQPAIQPTTPVVIPAKKDSGG